MKTYKKRGGRSGHEIKIEKEIEGMWDRAKISTQCLAKKVKRGQYTPREKKPGSTDEWMV